MWDLREQVSLLLASGHSDAMQYRVGHVWEEAEMVRTRMDHIRANDAILMQSTVGSLLDKQLGKEFKKHIDLLRKE